MNRAFGRFLAVLMLVWAANLPAQTVVDLGGVSNDGGAFVNFGIADSSNNWKVAMPLQFSEPAPINRVAVQLTKVGSPSDNAVIEVRQGSPDGTLLASGSVAGSAISASGSRHELTFPTFVVPLGSIAVVYTRSGASDARNFFKAVRGTSGSNYGIVTSGGYMYLKTGKSWDSSNLQNSPIISVFGSLVPLGQAAVSPSATINFGDVNVGATAQQQFRVRNTGTAALAVTAVSSNNSIFTLAPAIPPSVNVNVGDSTSVTVSFVPTAVGAASGNVTITHNGVNSPTVVAVSGNGVASGGGSGGSTPPPPTPSPAVPGITLLPASLAMDSLAVGGPGAYKTFEIRNDSTLTLNISNISVGGANAAEFLVSMNSAIIEAGGRRIVVVSFLPVTAGAKSAVVNISHNAPGGISTVPLTGLATPFLPGTSGAAIAITPNSVVFDTVGVGSSRTVDLTVSNPGSAPLVVYGIALGGEDPSHFSLSRTNLSVDPGQSRFINVTFTPASVGPKSAVLVLANNTANPALSIPLSGTTPVFFATPRVDISVDKQEGPAPLTVRFSNTNSGGFATYWDWKPGDRDEAGRQVSIIRHANGDTLTYTYSQPGVYRPILTVFGPGGGDAQPFRFFVTVLVPQPLAPILRVDSDSLQFGAIDVGGGIISSFRVFNTGTAQLNGRITLDGDNSFSVTSADSFSISPGSEDRTIVVRFAPQSAGVKSGRLIISYGGETRNVILTGEARSQATQDSTDTVVSGPRLDISATQVDLGSIFVGRDTSYVGIPIRNLGNAVLEGNWFLVDVSGSFWVNTDSTTLAPGLADTVTVSFTPQVVGEKAGRLYFFHNAGARPHVIGLIGEAKLFVASAELADFDNNGALDFQDFFLFADKFGDPSLSPAEIRVFDLNGDSRVDNDDFFIFADLFGRSEGE
ncbi:MAG: choice-of-anchor D domain-containing protein [Minisyncoccia bacterium]